MEQDRETRQYHFLKTDPAGNTTIFVLDKTETAVRASVANKLMEKRCGLCAEQVAFLDSDPPRPADFSITMMGGEFCGNATRSAAAWLVFDRERYQPSGVYGDKGEYEIFCSGVDHNIRCHVVMESRTRFDVTADMPLPLSMDMVRVLGETFWKVDCGGIVHFIRLCTSGVPSDNKEEWIKEILEQFPTPHGGATGIMFLARSPSDPSHVNGLDPYVYVKDTDTLVHESSCGSGTAASIAAVAASLGKSVSASVGQRSGDVITSKAIWENGHLASLCIGGPVDIVAEGIAYVNH